MKKLWKRMTSLALALTMLLGCMAIAEGTADEKYVHFICSPSQTRVTVVSLEAAYEDELSVKAKKALLSDWDGVSATLGEGDLLYRVEEHEHMTGMVHAFALDEGMYFVKAEAAGYAPISWTAVSVRYADGPMEMKLTLQPASSVPEKPAVTAAPTAAPDSSMLPKDDPAELQRVVFWCDPAKLSLTVEREDGEKVAPVSVSGAGEGNMDLVAVAEYVYLLPEGNYAYSASCAGYIPKTGVPFAVKDGEMMIDVSLQSERRSVQVTIVAPEGQEILRVYKANDAAERPLSADKDGVYGLAPGYYQCAVKAADGTEKVYNLTVSGERATQMFLLEPLMLVERSVQPVVFEKWQDGIELTVYTVDAAGDKVICEPDENGVYMLPVGTVWYDASAEGYVPVEGEPVQVEASLEMQVERIWLLSESRANVNRSRNVVIFAAIADKSGALPFGEELQAMMDELGLVRADYFYSTKRADGKYESVYYGTLAEDNVWFAVDMLTTSGEIAFAEPEYLYFTTAIDNPWYAGDQAYLEQQTWLEAQGVRAIWGDLEEQGVTPGEGVVVAVIDTGVDYTHPDLKNSIWTNWMELDGAEGVDDDGNGYVDDVYGWNFRGRDQWNNLIGNGNVQDDHGHGTHVAGIIAMADNGVGGVGLAYGAKIMAVKASESNGVFSSASVAQAVNYARASGADIINMSFGGNDNSTLVKNALEAASAAGCLLVTSAGNDGVDASSGSAMYPAAYPFVLGVMATNDAGTALADFSNWDSKPGAGSEYELAAPGQAIFSTLPGGRYARWSGTSMAAPVVSAAAAVLMSAGHTGNLTAQLVGSAGKATAPNGSVASLDLAAALNMVAKPELVLTNVAVQDGTALDENNNHDYVADPGETVNLVVTLKNLWSDATDITITADSLVDGEDQGCITWLDNTAVIDAIGTYGENHNGTHYINNVPSDFGDPLQFIVHQDIGNNTDVVINFHVTARNGLNPEDETVYEWDFTHTINVTNPYVLSGILREDTILDKSHKWIIRGSLQVPEGVSLTVTEGTHIHFEQIKTGDSSLDYLPYLQVLGVAWFQGTEAEPITITTDSALGIVGPNMNDCAYDEYYVGASYNNMTYALLHNYRYSGVVQTRGSYMSYVKVVGDRDYSTIMFDRAEHLDVTSCTVVGNILEDSRLDDCRILNFGDARSSDGCDVMQIYESNLTNCHWNRWGAYRDFSIAMSVFSGTRQEDYSSYQTMEAGSDFYLNAVLNNFNKPSTWFRLSANQGRDFDVSGNYWGSDDAARIDELIIDSYDNVAYGTVTYQPFKDSNSDMSDTYPFVMKAWLTGENGVLVREVKQEQTVTINVKFNRDMNTGILLDVSCVGEGYGPFTSTTTPVTGAWTNARLWQATVTLDPAKLIPTSQGDVYIRVANACAADDAWLTITPDDRHWFSVTNMAADIPTLRAEAQNDGIHLFWNQEDFETLAGFNIYRGTGEPVYESGDFDGDGSYELAWRLQGEQKINPVLVPGTERTFIDTDVEDGATYYYRFTAVDTDFNELGYIAYEVPSYITCTALDMTAPVIEHTPAASVLVGQPLAVSATVTDAIKVESVTLHVRQQSDSDWLEIPMTNTTGSLWFANITSASTDPIVYYITATDGVCTASWGSRNAPATVLVESLEYTLGDLNADGSIDIVDLMMMTQSIVGTKTLTVTQTKAADVNVDGSVDVFDLMKVAQYICGMIESL